MSLYATTKEQIRLDIELAVQKRVAVSVADRFGTHSSLFRQQFEQTNCLGRRARKVEQLQDIRNKVDSLHTEIANRSKEVEALLHFDPKKVDALEALSERVDELKTDLDFEVDRVQSLQDEQYAAQSDTLPGRGRELEDTLLQWRLERAPTCGL
ncbi:hypothetical protein OvHV-2gp32 [Ovine gammaherpesvirus 2]|uniref:Tegument protein UL14 n=1 Tax=Ovine gammaherpesvirus 2 TaxID=10398 RepID=A1BM23_9GAMA|nr:hypothetical protein OvHV-2gp32 [Ovine gammaherpesvirus 2]